MPRLPRVSGREARRAFERAGWTYSRTRGDHMILRRLPGKRSLVVPDHDALASFIRAEPLRTAGLTVDEFLDLLELHRDCQARTVLAAATSDLRDAFDPRRRARL